MQILAPSGNMLYRVLIADDHQLIAEGLRRIIESSCNVVGTAGNGKDVITAVESLKPDLVLLDVSMPLMNGLDACRRIKAVAPEVRVIFVTMQRNQEFVREAFEAGASGYILKQSAAAELMAAMKEVMEGLFAMSPSLSHATPDAPIAYENNPSKLFTILTPRQREVLQLVAEGKTAKQIANALAISVKTVEFHKKHLMNDLQLHNSSELVRYAVENELVQQ